jgi:hypothetical protein
MRQNLTARARVNRLLLNQEALLKEWGDQIKPNKRKAFEEEEEEIPSVVKKNKTVEEDEDGDPYDLEGPEDGEDSIDERE